jgi:hypothetical protein
MHHAKARHCNDGSFVLEKGQPIAFALLHLDATGKLSSGKHRPKLAHHRKATINLLPAVRNVN